MGNTVSIYYMKSPSGSVCHNEQADVSPPQLQSAMTKSPSDGEQFLHSQQQTFNYQINSISLYCMVENHHHFLNVERQ